MNSHFFHICSTGEQCFLQNTETVKIHDYLVKKGLTFTSNPAKANTLFIVLCGHTKETEERSLRAIDYYRKKSPRAVMVAAGCLPKIYPKLVRSVSDCLILPADKHALEARLGFELRIEEIKDPQIGGRYPFPLATSLQIRNTAFYHKDLLQMYASIGFRPLFGHLRTIRVSNLPEAFKARRRQGTYYIRVSSGCSGRCTFCAEKFALGSLRSRKIMDIIRQFRSALRAGNTDFAIFSDDLANYGEDIGTNVHELLQSILSVPGAYNLSLRGFNPAGLSKYNSGLQELFKEHKDKIKMINVPIQSGSNRILKLMRRDYTIGNTMACLRSLRELLPSLDIWTIIICGFPGETNEDFLKTKELITGFRFGFVRFHVYSDRPATPAFDMLGKIPKRVAFKRVNELASLQSLFGRYAISIK